MIAFEGLHIVETGSELGSNGLKIREQCKYIARSSLPRRLSNTIIQYPIIRNEGVGRLPQALILCPNRPAKALTCRFSRHVYPRQLTIASPSPTRQNKPGLCQDTPHTSLK